MTEDAEGQAKEGRGGTPIAKKNGVREATNNGESELGSSRSCTAVRSPLVLRYFERRAPSTKSAVGRVCAHGANGDFGRFGQCAWYAWGSRQQLVVYFPQVFTLRETLTFCVFGRPPPGG